MLQRDCMIVRDLLASYTEELTSDNTKTFIEKHLKECSKCREYYQDLLETQDAESALEKGLDKRFLYKLRRYRYQLIGALLGVVLTIVFIIGWGLYGIWTSKKRNTTEVFTKNVEDYGDFEEYYGLSELSTFPERDFVGIYGDIRGYVYKCYGSKLYQTCQIYLECEYITEEAYEKEVTRLQQIKNKETGLSVIYCVDSYEYPAIYAMKNAEYCNEYVLLPEGELKIIYIYLQGSVDRRDLHFVEDYLPYDYGQDGMNFENVESYSIYPGERYVD